MKHFSREEALDAIALSIDAVDLPHPVRVGVDGVSASGKTVFADELCGILRGMGHNVIRAGVDGFHNPPEVRHRRGGLSVKGYMEDSFNLKAIREYLLVPLGPGGDLSFLSSVYDHKVEKPTEQERFLAFAGSILIFEGVMLFRDELADFFDYKILVHVSHEVALERAKVRDLEHFGGMEQLLKKYNQRFIPGQRLYQEQCDPRSLADVVLGNEDWARPRLEFRPPD